MSHDFELYFSDDQINSLQNDISNLMKNIYKLNNINFDNIKKDNSKLQSIVWKISNYSSRNDISHDIGKIIENLKLTIRSLTISSEIIIRCFKSIQKNSPLPSKLYEEARKFTQNLKNKNISLRKDGFYLIKFTSLTLSKPLYHIGHTINLSNRLKSYYSALPPDIKSEIILHIRKNGRYWETEAKNILKLNNNNNKYNHMGREKFFESEEKLDQIEILKNRIKELEEK